MADEHLRAGDGRESHGDAFICLSEEPAGPVCQGRSGFGALRRLESILRNSVRLAIESGFFARRKSDGSWPWFAIDPVAFFHFPFRHGAGAHHRVFFENVLGAPSSFDPAAFWAIFWALAKSEHEFLLGYTPLWSHEERLTGHLVSQILERIEEFAGHWRSLAGVGPEAAHCRIWYADTAIARREKTTGADLGLVVHAQPPPPESPEFFKVARFQAKKAAGNGNASIDRDQVEALTQPENLGYYFFYHRLDPKRWSPAPTVRAASEFAHELNKVKEKRNAKRPFGSVSTIARDNGYGTWPQLSPSVSRTLRQNAASSSTMHLTPLEPP